MKENYTEETFFREIMSKSKLDLPFSDFDDKVMKLIQNRNSKKTSILKDIKLSWIFFILGTACGIAVSIILPGVKETIFGISAEELKIPFLIVFAFILVTQLDSLLEIRKRQKD